jgi:acetylornithine deacetylase/succinyl-diaminopimelate desuccinylase-like protein
MRSKILAVCLMTCTAVVQAQTSPDFTQTRDEVSRLLQDVVRIDTSNGHETKVAEYLKGVFDKEGIPSEILSTDPDRANIIARIKGNGRKRPLLIIGHSDVVGVEREKWTVDPFGSVVKDGYIYGRGTYDDKDNLAASVEVMLMLHRMKVPLDRDVIFLSESGEEGNTSVGIEFLVNKHWDKLDSEYAILEGGGMILDEKGKLVSIEVSTSEKIPNTTTLVAHGTSGHGSIPRPDNPVVHLAAAVAKIGEFQSPMRLNDTTRTYFQRYASISSPEEAFIYTHLEDPAVGTMVREKLRVTNYTQYSMLHTSISPTIINGGFRSNVIPGDAKATLDIRALPDEDMGEFFATLRRVINDPLVDVVPPANPGRPRSEPSRIDSELFQALEKAGKKVFPEAVTIPIMLNGATDGAYLRGKGVQCFGIGTINEGRLHGNDERVSIENLGKFVEFLYSAVTDVAGSR